MKSNIFCSLLLAVAVLLGVPVGTGGAATANAAEPGALADPMFDEPQVIPLKLEIPGPSLESLKKEPKRYVKATLREGDKVYADVGVRLKGSGGFLVLEKKPSLAVKFNEFTSGTLFHGYSRVHLSQPSDDPTFLMEAIGGGLFRAAGVPAAKITFARVEVNGKDLGLYLLQQAVNRDFLADYFRKTKGNLYEGSNADVNEKLEQDGGDPSPGQKDLRELAAAAREGDHGQRLRKLDEVLDLDRFISFLAVEVFTWHSRGYGMKCNNYRIYHDPSSGRMVFIPHGYDELFEQTEGALMPEWKGLVAKGLLETPDGQRRYRKKMAELLPTVFKVEPLHARINQLAGKIRPVIAPDGNAVRVFDAGVAQLRERIAERHRNIAQQLK